MMIGGHGRAAPERRRRRGWMVLRVAGVVGSAVTVVVVAVVADRSDDGAARDEPSAGSQGSPGSASRWRTEYWRGLRVDVPAVWGFGGAPMGDGYVESGAIACGATAMVSASGDQLRREDPTMPYVGRPIAQTDVCAVYPWVGPYAGPPQSPYVWLDGAVEPGVVELGDGYIQETVDVDGVRLTVATQDAVLRRQILESATEGMLCRPEVDERDAVSESMMPASAAGTSMTVCVYRRSIAGDAIRLAYATQLEGDAIEEYRAALRSASAPKPCSAADRREHEWAVLQISRDGKEPLHHVVHFGCPGVNTDPEALGSSPTIGLTPDVVRPWAVHGVPAVLYGPTGGRGAMLSSFIGPIG